MTAIQFLTKNQKLIIHSSSATLYTEAAASNAVTLPKVISADVTYYTAPGIPKTAVICRRPDGRKVYDATIGTGAWQSAATVEPADDYDATTLEGQLYTAGREILPRDLAVASITQTSQVLRYRSFTALATESITGLAFMTSTTAAGATPSLIKYGLFSVADDDALALLASTAHDAALLAAASTVYPKSFVTPYTIEEGKRYAAGLLVVTAAAAPTVVATGTVPTVLAALKPRMGGSITGQADLPASVVAANVNTGSAGATPWAALIPA